MMNTQKLVQSSLLAVAGCLGVGVATAASTSGPVEQVYADSTNTYIYVSPSSFLAVPSYVYSCYTSDPEIARAIVASLHKNVYLVCGNTSWPTSGSYRYGGAVSYLYAN